MDIGITIDDIYMLLITIGSIHLFFQGYIAGKQR